MVAASLIAQAGIAGTIGWWAIALIVVAAAVGIVLAIVRAAGLEVPQFMVTILWIVFAAAIGILAIKFILYVAGA